MADLSNKRLAVLIDADNAQPAIAESLLAEVAKYGIASVKRCYGDWTGSHLRGWKDTLLTHSIQPIQQFGYTSGKNATDSALIIDAMDLLYTKAFDGFCIVSSDSDFTRLASRLRESGQTVYGFGEQKTPKPFVAACDRFIYTEILARARDVAVDATVVAPPPQIKPFPLKPLSPKELKGDTKLLEMLRNAVEDSSDEAGWSLLSTIGSQLRKQAADFDERNYGYFKLGELFRAIDVFEVESRKLGDSTTIVVRDRRKR